MKNNISNLEKCLRLKPIADEILLSLEPEDIKHLAFTSKQNKVSVDEAMSFKKILIAKLNNVISKHINEQKTQTGKFTVEEVTQTNQGIDQESQTEITISKSKAQLYAELREFICYIGTYVNVAAWRKFDSNILKQEVEKLLDSKLDKEGIKVIGVGAEDLSISKNPECKVSINKLKLELLDHLDNESFYKYKIYLPYCNMECDDVDNLTYSESTMRRDKKFYGEIKVPSKIINIHNLNYSFSELEQYVATKQIRRDATSENINIRDSDYSFSKIKKYFVDKTIKYVDKTTKYVDTLPTEKILFAGEILFTDQEIQTNEPGIDQGTQTYISGDCSELHISYN